MQRMGCRGGRAGGTAPSRTFPSTLNATLPHAGADTAQRGTMAYGRFAPRMEDGMTRILGLLMHGCWHVWEARSENFCYGALHDGPIVYCECKKCGRWRSFWGILPAARTEGGDK